MGLPHSSHTTMYHSWCIIFLQIHPLSVGISDVNVLFSKAVLWKATLMFMGMDWYILVNSVINVGNCRAFWKTFWMALTTFTAKCRENSRYLMITSPMLLFFERHCFARNGLLDETVHNNDEDSGGIPNVLKHIGLLHTRLCSYTNNYCTSTISDKICYFITRFSVYIIIMWLCMRKLSYDISMLRGLSRIKDEIESDENQIRNRSFLEPFLWPFCVLTDAETDADHKRFRNHGYLNSWTFLLSLSRLDILYMALRTCFTTRCRCEPMTHFLDGILHRVTLSVTLSVTLTPRWKWRSS